MTLLFFRELDAEELVVKSSCVKSNSGLKNKFSYCSYFVPNENPAVEIL